MKEKNLEKIFKALANRRRIKIIYFLRQKKQANVGEIAEAIKLSFRSTSKHLKILTLSGILETEKTSLYVMYSISKEPNELLKKLLGFL